MVIYKAQLFLQALPIYIRHIYHFLDIIWKSPPLPVKRWLQQFSSAFHSWKLPLFQFPCLLASFVFLCLLFFDLYLFSCCVSLFIWFQLRCAHEYILIDEVTFRSFLIERCPEPRYRATIHQSSYIAFARKSIYLNFLLFLSSFFSFSLSFQFKKIIFISLVIVVCSLTFVIWATKVYISRFVELEVSLPHSFIDWANPL